MPSDFSYRHYQSLHPVANRLLAQKWDAVTHQSHINRLSHITPTISIAPPLSLPSAVSSKKQHLQHSRQLEIARLNHLLVTKIDSLKSMNAQTQFSHIHYHDQMRLCREKERKRREQSIAKANVSMVERLEKKEAVYDRKKWQEEEKDRENVLRRIGMFPYKNSARKVQQVKKDGGVLPAIEEGRGKLSARKSGEEMEGKESKMNKQNEASASKEFQAAQQMAAEVNADKQPQQQKSSSRENIAKSEKKSSQISLLLSNAKSSLSRTSSKQEITLTEKQKSSDKLPTLSKSTSKIQEKQQSTEQPTEQPLEQPLEQPTEQKAANYEADFE